MKLRINGVEYPLIDNPTIGELRVLKREFGVADVTDLTPTDPDHMAGLIYLSMHRADPDVTVADVDAVTEVEVLDDEGNAVEEGAERPTDAPAA